MATTKPTPAADSKIHWLGSGGVEQVVVKPAVKQDFDLIDLLPGQDPTPYIEQYLRSDTYTILHDGEILAIMGAYPVWEGRSICWALMGKPSQRKMLILTRQVLKYLENTPITRLEAQVLSTFKPGIRWALMLGFEYEGEMRKFSDNKDFILLARVK